MYLYFLAIAVGLVLLVWSSDKFVDGAAAVAENFGISKLMVGLTIVSFGTSAPEILVSAIASFDGAPGLAVGNALGSNIANIGLVLGITAVIVNVPVHKLSARQDLPVYLIVCVLTAWVLHDNFLGPMDTLILFTTLFAISFLVIFVRSKVTDPLLIKELTEEAEYHQKGNLRASIEFVVGLLVLLLSSRILVWSAVSVAEGLGIDEVVIGLTIVAIGTSLPELAATLASALKKHHDLAIGNILGSNILNLLVVLPLPGIINAGVLDMDVFRRDFAVMAFMSLLMAAFVFIPRKNPNINRLKGVVLVSAYASYLFVLVQSVI